MSYIPKHSQNHVHEEYVLYVNSDSKEAKFIGRKQTHKHSTSLLHCDSKNRNQYSFFWHAI